MCYATLRIRFPYQKKKLGNIPVNCSTKNDFWYFLNKENTIQYADVKNTFRN
jgi:hypothetical protein